MRRDEIDQLYHLLRVASNEPTDYSKGFPLQSTVLGLAKHLLAGGDYLALIQYSSRYGEEFLLQPTFEAIKNKEWKPGRVVEFGAGLAWLGRGLSARLDLIPTLFVDKRPWTLTDVVADLETKEGADRVLLQLKPDDLIVMSDFLHCLDEPTEVVDYFGPWPMAILEYCPTNPEYRESFKTQIERYGATLMEPKEFEAMFPNREVDIIDLDPYMLLMVEGKHT